MNQMLSAMINPMFTMGTDLVKRQGIFSPYVGVTKIDGTFEYFAFSPDILANPVTFMQSLSKLLRSGASQFQWQAVAVGMHQHIDVPGRTDPSPAVRVFFEHKDGDSIACALPYARGADGTPAFGKMIAEFMEPFISELLTLDQPGPPRVFMH